MKTFVTISNCPLEYIERKRICLMIKDYLDIATNPETLLKLRKDFRKSTRPKTTEYNRLFQNAFRYATYDIKTPEKYKWKVGIEIK